MIILLIDNSYLSELKMITSRIWKQKGLWCNLW